MNYRTDRDRRRGRRYVALGILPAALLLAVCRASAAAPVEDTLAQRVLACTACHGPEGRATPDGYQPRIAGKPPAYLFNQLQNFRDGRRRYGPMVAMVDHLSDDYLREIAGHFAALDLPHAAPPPPKATPTVLDRGRQLANEGDASRRLPACTRCHGQALTGALPAIPGLLGLPADYLAAQVGAWRSGQRRAQSPDCMKEIAQRLDPGDVAAVAAWLASRPVPPGQPVAAATLAPLPLDCGGLK